MLHGLDLFTGIGGFAWGLAQWVRPICYVEIDPYCQAVLKTRFDAGNLPPAPVWDDVRTFNGKPFKGMVDIITAGFPCQDISAAGNAKGLDGERSGLFFQVLRLAQEIRPQYILLENVAAIRTRGLETVGRELAALRYDCRWEIISANETGAPHVRKRWFCLANLVGTRREGAKGGLFKKKAGGAKPFRNNLPETNWDLPLESCLVRVVYGLPFAMDRIKCLGNAVVPAQAAFAFKKLMGV